MPQSSTRWSRAWAVVSGVWARLSEDNVSVLAAAVGFYAFLSIFPALTAIVSLYGLFANPTAVQQQVAQLRQLLPADALSLISSWLQALAQKPPTTFGLGLIVSVLLSLWSAGYATSTIMTALNIAYEVPEGRGLVRFYTQAMVLTAVLVLFVVLGVALLAVLPAVIGMLPLASGSQGTALLVRWPLLLVFAMVAIAAVYRFGPDRDEPRWELVSLGALLATIMVALGSYAFSFYVNQFAMYDKTYGSLGAVAVLLVWLWLCAYAVLTGAEVNAVIAKVKSGPRPAPAAAGASPRHTIEAAERRTPASRD